MKIDKLNIVRVTDDNIHDFVNVINNVAYWLEKNDMYVWNSGNLTKEKLLSKFKKEEMYIGYIDDVAISTITLQDRDFEFWGENSGNENAIYIHRLSVLRDYAGQGISHKLLDFARNFAIENSFSKLRLDCRDRPKLRKVYESYGFRPVGLVKNPNDLHEFNVLYEIII